MIFWPFLFFLISASASEVDDCSSKCDSTTHEPSCVQGCIYAYALTLSPDAPADRPTCQKACEDNLEGHEEKACEIGCNQFKNESEPFNIRGILSLMRNFVSNMWSNAEPNQVDAAEPEPESSPFTLTRIRIFIPLGEPDKDLPDAFPPELTGPVDGMAAPPPNKPHHMIMHAGQESSKAMHHDFRGAYWFRRVIHAPFLLLFVVSMSVLVILFIVQLAVCLRRRRVMVRGYQYTPLPTYAEATNVKVPVFDDDEVKQPLKEPEANA